jgi:hypothetical protein
MITNIYDLTGRHNMAQIYVDLAFGEVPRIDETRDIVADQYLVRDYDTPPLIASLQEIAGDGPGGRPTRTHHKMAAGSGLEG